MEEEARQVIAGKIGHIADGGAQIGGFAVGEERGCGSGIVDFVAPGLVAEPFEIDAGRIDEKAVGTDFEDIVDDFAKVTIGHEEVQLAGILDELEEFFVAGHGVFA